MEERKLQCESVAEKVNNERASFRDSLVLLCWMGSGEKIPRRDKCYEICRYFCSRQVSFGDSHHPLTFLIAVVDFTINVVAVRQTHVGWHI